MKKLVIAVALGVVLLSAIYFFLFTKLSPPTAMAPLGIDPKIGFEDDTKSPPTAKPRPGKKSKILPGDDTKSTPPAAPSPAEDPLSMSRVVTASPAPSPPSPGRAPLTGSRVVMGSAARPTPSPGRDTIAGSGGVMMSPRPATPSSVMKPNILLGDDLEAIVREKVKALSTGKILFNPPEEMIVEEKVRVEARVTPDLAADLSTGLRGPGKPISADIKVSPFMKVKLHGEKFRIVSYSDEQQPVLDLPDRKFTQWEWDVTPENSGWHSLVLSVKTVIKIPNRPDECIDYPVLERKIHVKINPVHTTTSFIGTYWQWIVGTILIPLIGWLYNRWRKT